MSQRSLYDEAGPAASAATGAEAGEETDAAAAGLVGRSPALLDALWRIRRIAATDATALIGGESGTGKELAARAIHYLGARRNKPFICVNCGALPDGLIESELFGHERGAFTGASGPAAGLVADAEGGTLFLDEVEEMSRHTQVALLRFLQDRSYRPVGSRRFLRGDVRVIAASNVCLMQLAREGRFRQDLLFRLRLMVVDMPPLRRRAGDIALLARLFLHRLAQQYGGAPKRIPAPLLEALCRYDWPGNVRELENLLHRAHLFSDGPELRIEPAELAAQDGGGSGEGGGFALGTGADVQADAGPVSGPDTGAAVAAPAPLPAGASFAQAKALALEQFERAYVDQALRESRGNISAAARRAGKERRAFGRLVKKYGMGAWAAQEPEREGALDDA